MKEAMESLFLQSLPSMARMRSSSLSASIRLNNNGVDLFASGRDHAGASKCFQQAFQLLQKHCKKSITLSKNKKNHIVDTSAKGCPNQQDRPALTGPLDANHSMNYSLRTRIEFPAMGQSLLRILGEDRSGATSLSSRIDDEVLFISTRPVKLTPPSTIDDLSIFDSSHKSSIIYLTITFNLALSLHLRSFTAPAPLATRLLHSALSLYNIVVTLRFKNAQRYFRESRLAHLDFSILNNMGALHHGLGNASCARHFFQKLELQLQKLDPSHPLRTETSGFVGNVKLFLRTSEWNNKPASAA